MKRSVLGVFLILLGGVLLLRNFGWLPYETRYIFQWFNIFFVIGVSVLISSKGRDGFLFIGLGLLFAIPYYTYFGWGDLWPLILIFIGVTYFTHRRGQQESESGDTSINEFTIFSGSKRSFANQEFKGGKITTMFGGSELDFRDSELADNSQLDIFCMFGGIDITAPADWSIDLRANPIFGGVSDERRNRSADGPTLRVKGFVMFGGVDIMN